MSQPIKECSWKASIDIRIAHPALDPDSLTELLEAVPQIAQKPGESRVPHGNCQSAGYWCIVKELPDQEKPDVLILWAEDFVATRQQRIRELIEAGYDVNVYLGIHSNVMTLGFVLPATPKIWELGIPVGLEFFS